MFKHAAWCRKSVRLYHFRSCGGQEVDIVVEDGQEQVVGIEVKLSATPSAKDFAGLRMLKAHLKKKFVRWLLIYTGNDVVPFEKNLHAVPIQYFMGSHG